ncbi:MAG: carbohydrate ABC transporter permease [Clostridia bacterium]|nr:carbohydrate ABC transporter permease [Clostridia bacterium]
MKKSGAKHTVYLIVKVIVLLSFLTVVLFPFYWLFQTSFKTPRDIAQFPPTYLPNPFVWDNYATIFRMQNFGRYIMNSVSVSLVASFMCVLIGLLGSYVLARFDFKGKSKILMFYLITQMIPGFLGMAALYTMISKFGMMDKLTTLMILYTVMLIPYCTITLRGFFAQVPRALEEAAQIDGCNRVAALFRVILPVILPGVSATFMFSFVQCWNEVFSAIMYINRSSSYTIPVALNSLVLKYDVKWGELSAGAVISIVPSIGMFAFAQKYIASGLVNGAVKG